jgi:hypothetical protein
LLLLFVGAAATGELRREIFQSIKIDFAKKKKKKKQFCGDELVAHKRRDEQRQLTTAKSQRPKTRSILKTQT